MLKDVAPDELAEVVRKATSGEAVLHPRVAARVVQEMHGMRSGEPNPFRELGEREIEVLRPIARGLANAEVASQMVISEKTVENYAGNLLGKPHLAGRTQAAVFAGQQGIVRRG